MILAVETCCRHPCRDRPFILEKTSDMGQLAGGSQLQPRGRDAVSAPAMGRLDELNFVGIYAKLDTPQKSAAGSSQNFRPTDFTTSMFHVLRKSEVSSSRCAKCHGLIMSLGTILFELLAIVLAETVTSVGFTKVFRSSLYSTLDQSVRLP